jgi:hypothetical protein
MSLRTSRSAFDGYVQRLLQSANPVERDSTYWGHTLHHEYPVLVPVPLLFEHVHILGGTGTGKTALGIAPLMIQLIRRSDGPVMVLDLKGDNALFHTAQIEAAAVNRTFKWFTNKPGRSTYIFNPWRQGYLEGMAIQEILGLFLLSLNLHHGDDYGRAFFSLASRTMLQDCLKQALDLEQVPRRRGSQGQDVPQSFVELEAQLRQMSASNEEYRAGQHLMHVLQSLIDFPQLNMTSTRNPDEPATEHAIHMPDVITDNQVVYFYLQAVMDITTVAEIARLALYSILTAALAYRDATGKPPRVYVITDEAQHLVAQNIANVLAQAREHGVSCILAHQSMSQLNPPGGVDLRELFLSCTSVKQFWSARDPALKDHISKISGEVNYYSASWPQFKGRVRGGEIGRQFAASKPGERPYIQISESPGPRLASQDLEDHSRQPNTSILSIERNAGMCCFQGAFPVHMDWIMPESVYEKRKLELPWPEPSDETIVVEGIWPATNAEGKADDGVTANSNKDPGNRFQADEDSSVVKKLDVLKRRKRGNKEKGS